MLVKYMFDLVVDHFTFYVEDPSAEPDYAVLWDGPRANCLTSTREGIIAVQTARFGGPTAVEVRVHDSAPTTVDRDPDTLWDRIEECQLRVTSGVVGVYS